jgi:hypothetical protein
MAEEIDRNVIEQLDKAGEKLLGDSWALALGGFARDGGIKPERMQQYLRNQDPVDALYRDGKERLLARLPSGVEASTSDSESIQAANKAEHEYSRIRAQEREVYARMKGRIR